MKGWNYTNFESHLAMMWCISLSSSNSTGQSVFQLESRKRNVDKQMDKQMTELHQFRQESSYDDDLSPCQVWIWLDKPFSS